MTNNAITSNARNWIWLAASCIAFGALMAWREEIPSIWARAFIAGCAFIILVQAFSRVRKAKM